MPGTLRTFDWLSGLRHALRSRENQLAAVCAGLLILVVVLVWWSMGAQAAQVRSHHVVKASISDCTATSESASQIDTSQALLEGLSFAEGNPFFANPRKAMVNPILLALPTDSWVEKAEFAYDEAGRVKSCQLMKSTNPLSSATFSYDSHGAVSKVVGWRYLDEDGQATRHDFEASFVNEELSSGVFGANKITVVHSDPLDNDTITFVYDKDKNLNEIKSTGGHPWQISCSYVTAFKVTKDIRVSEGDANKGRYLVPTYDEQNRLVLWRTGTWSGDGAELDDGEYSVQYSGAKYSKVDYYEGDTQVRYYQFHYTGDDLTAIRVYRKGGEQLYTISLTWN